MSPDMHAHSCILCARTKKGLFKGILSSSNRSKKHANTVTQGEAWCRGHDSAGLGFNGPNGSMGWQTETWL